MISASKSAISCHFLMISEGTRARAGMVSSSLIFQQVETPFARPAAADLWNVSDDERQFGDRGPQFPVSSTQCLAASGLVTEVPTGLENAIPHQR